MTVVRAALAVIVLALGALIQSVVLTRLDLPGATPDLVLVLVVTVGLLRGPAEGGIAGFATGLLVDLMPPTDTVMGLSSLVLLLAGAGAGAVRDSSPRLSIWRVMLALAATAGGSVIAWSLLSGLVNAPSVVWAAVPLLIVSEVGYCLVMGSVIVPVALWLDRRTSPRVEDLSLA